MAVIWWVYAVELVAALVPAALFVVLYAARSAWRSSEMGRHLLWYGAVVAGLLGLSVWGLFVGAPWWPVYLLGMAAFDVVLWWRVLLVLKAQRRL